MSAVSAIHALGTAWGMLPRAGMMRAFSADEFIALIGDNRTPARKLAPMSAERSGKSHAIAWTLSIFAVPVLYVLTLPPIFFFVEMHFTSSPGIEEFMNTYCEPYGWLVDQKALQKPLRAYADFWRAKFHYNPFGP
jgi:hypothetical protein